MSDERIDTGGGSAVGGNVDSTEFSGRDRNEQRTEVNVNFPPAWNPTVSHGQDRGLSVTDAELLKGEVFALRKDMNSLTLSIGKLDQTLDTTVANQFKLTDKRVTALEAIADRLINQERNERPTFDKRTSTLIIIGIVLIVILLGLQTWSDLSRNAISAQTGAAYVGAVAAWFVAFRNFWV